VLVLLICNGIGGVLMKKFNIIRVRKFLEIALLTKAFAIAAPKPVALIPIGPQGCGKTSLGLYLSRKIRSFEIISQDEIRKSLFLQMYPEENGVGFEKIYEALRPKEPEIRRKAIEALKSSTKEVVYVDRMNLTSASRSDFIIPERFTVAIYFDLPLDEILRRHKNRPDKVLAIPDHIVISCFNMAEFPKRDEFDARVILSPISIRREESGHRKDKGNLSNE
jgi:hypothetical protein